MVERTEEIECDQRLIYEWKTRCIYYVIQMFNASMIEDISLPEAWSQEALYRLESRTFLLNPAGI